METMQAPTSECWSSRAWLMLRLLAPLSATTLRSCSSVPGLSSTLVVISVIRPD